MIFSGHDSQHMSGVGILMKNEIVKSLIGFYPVSDRVILAKLQGSPFNVAIIQVYAPTSASTDEDLKKFYSDLDAAKCLCRSGEMVSVMGDLNAKVGQRSMNTSEFAVLGQHSVGERNECGEE